MSAQRRAALQQFHDTIFPSLLDTVSIQTRRCFSQLKNFLFQVPPHIYISQFFLSNFLSLTAIKLFIINTLPKLFSLRSSMTYNTSQWWVFILIEFLLALKVNNFFLNIFSLAFQDKIISFLGFLLPHCLFLSPFSWFHFISPHS